MAKRCVCLGTYNVIDIITQVVREFEQEVNELKI